MKFQQRILFNHRRDFWGTVWENGGYVLYSGEVKIRQTLANLSVIRNCEIAYNEMNPAARNDGSSIVLIARY